MGCNENKLELAETKEASRIVWSLTFSSLYLYCNTVVPNLFATRDQFLGRQFFHGWGVVGWGDGSGGNANNGERQMKICWLIRCSPPAVWPGCWGPLL